MSKKEVRDGVLVLAHHTSWSLEEIKKMTASEFVFWVGGVVDHAKQAI